MANMIGNNNNGSGGGGINTNNVVVGGIGSGVVVGLRDVVSNYLQPAPLNPAAPFAQFDHILEMIRGLDLQDDGIQMNHKIKSIETDFCNIVRDENMLCESMDYLNEKALGDGEIALKFALLFSSRNFDALAMKETKVRSAMLKILEANFLNAETYRVQDKERLYNSITLLGEYYHRVRLADNTPITILGESLLGLLMQEISASTEVIGVKLAKLVLSQITLNGDIMRVKHKAELTQLLYHIRRHLIEQPSLKPAVKALLLMTLDLYYSNFANLGKQLEDMYTKYLVQEDEDEGNNNNHQNRNQVVPPTPTPPPQTQPQTYQSQISQQQQPSQQNVVFENGGGIETPLATPTIAASDSFEMPNSTPTTKKWSEQVCEDSFYESEFATGIESEYNLRGTATSNSGSTFNSYGGKQQQHDQQHHGGGGGDHESVSSRNSRRSYQPRSSPRPLKQNFNNYNESNEAPPQHFNHHQQQQQQSSPQHNMSGGGSSGGGTGDEELDQSKPLPRWRAPRFNRDGNPDQQHDPRQRHQQQRRFSASFDDDRQSVRSEGGSIRLYSINDRLKHSQEKIAGSSPQYNSIANSNWDRQSQQSRDDRSERSYISNYERGGNQHRRGGGGGRHHFNSRQTYDKPPRFLKNQNQHHQQQFNHSNKDGNGKIHSEAWRRSQHAAPNSPENANSYQDENSSYRSNGPESNSRSSSRARTLPRPAKSHMDGSGGVDGYQQQRQPSNTRGPRYGSQNSLASEASTSTLDRRQHHYNNHSNNHPHHQQRRNYGRRPQQPPQNDGEQQQQQQQQQDWADTHSVHGQPEEASWSAKDNNSELVRNARQTTKYMNYLSSQK